MRTYKEFINNILKTRGRFSCGEEYHERHHIMPKCMGGTDNDDNLIDLYAHEHFIAHKLLAQENPDNTKLVYAWWMMSVSKGNSEQGRYELSAIEYEEARIAFINSQKGHKATIGAREKMSEAVKKRYKEDPSKNPMYGKTGVDNHASRAVICLETNMTYGSSCEAERDTGIGHSRIIACCRGRRKSAGKHPVTGEKLHWKYIDENHLENNIS